MKQELIEALKRGFMGRLDAAQTVADILMPDALTVSDLNEIKVNCEAAAEVLKAEAVEIEVEPEKPAAETWPGKDKDEFDTFFKPPVKSKRKKA